MLLNCTIYNITCLFLKHSFITYHVNIVFRPMCRKTEIFIFLFLTIDLLIFWFLCASFCWKLSYPYQGKKLLINRCQSFFFFFFLISDVMGKSSTYIVYTCHLSYAVNALFLLLFSLRLYDQEYIHTLVKNTFIVQ